MEVEMESFATEAEYLKESLGECLAAGLLEVVERHPRDPIEYLGLFLHHYRRLHPPPRPPSLPEPSPESKPPPVPKSLADSEAPIPGSSDTGVDSLPSIHRLCPRNLSQPLAVWTCGAVSTAAVVSDDVDPISQDFGDWHIGDVNPDLFVHQDAIPVLRRIGDVVDDDDCFDNG